MVDVQSERQSGREFRRETTRIERKERREGKRSVCLWRNVTVWELGWPYRSGSSGREGSGGEKKQTLKTFFFFKNTLVVVCQQLQRFGRQQWQPLLLWRLAKSN